jgi:hypothetical protein
MAVSIVAGANGLIQLGLSISDLALLIDQGKKFGNFIRAGQNDNDLFDILDEDREALLRRHGLVDTSTMEGAWPGIGFVHQGVKKKSTIGASISTRDAAPEGMRWKKTKNTPDGVDSFTWVMVAIVSALDECLPSNEMQKLLIRVFVTVLNRDDEIATALNIHIRRNIESWRSFGCARGIAHSIKKEMRKSLAGSVSNSVRQGSIPMIGALGVERWLENLMLQACKYGTEAADDMELFGKADGPYEDKKEVYYTLEIPSSARVSKIYDPHIGMQADQGFPGGSEKIYEALEWLLRGEPPNSAQWLHNHVTRDYLSRIDNTHSMLEKDFASIFCKYQALIFGFFYQLLRQILCFDLVEPTAFFHGFFPRHMGCTQCHVLGYVHSAWS